MKIDKAATRLGKSHDEMILNVGCGNQPYGDVRIDMYPGSANLLCDVEGRFPIRDGVFKEVYSRYSFEHLRNPSSVLSEMVRVTRPGGRVVVITDNASCLTFHIPVRKLGWGIHVTQGWSRGREDAHYGVYTPFHLENHFRSCGLQNISVELVWTSEVGGPEGLIQTFVKALGLARIPLLRRFVLPGLLAIGEKANVGGSVQADRAARDAPHTV